MVVRPAVERLADELAPVVDLDAFWCLPALRTDPGHDVDNIAPANRRVGVDRQALPAKVVDYRYVEVDDIARFESDRQFFSYCRVVPGASNSGDRGRHKRSRDGNRYLKMAFSHAAVRATQYYPEVRAWYGSKKRRKPDVVARALVAKEIARVVYHVLSKHQDFNGQFKGVALSQSKKEQWLLLPSPTV